jgi:hypothetical protein
MEHVHQCSWCRVIYDCKWEGCIFDYPLYSAVVDCIKCIRKFNAKGVTMPRWMEVDD